MEKIIVGVFTHGSGVCRKVVVGTEPRYELRCDDAA